MAVAETALTLAKVDGEGRLTSRNLRVTNVADGAVAPIRGLGGVLPFEAHVILIAANVSSQPDTRRQVGLGMGTSTTAMEKTLSCRRGGGAANGSTATKSPTTSSEGQRVSSAYSKSQITAPQYFDARGEVQLRHDLNVSCSLAVSFRASPI